MTDPNPAGTPKIVNYGSNSKAAKAETPAVTPSAVPQVVTGVVTERKKTLGRKFREQFRGDDARTVAELVIFDVVLPAMKNLIFDVGTEALKRTLFGGARPGGVVASSVLGSARAVGTNYRAFSGSTPAAIAAAGTPASRDMTPEQRAMHDFSGILLDNRADAELVRDVLTQQIDDFGVATVNDFYAAVGVTPEFTSVKYGWKTLAQAQVRQTRDGYLLEMPRPQFLD